jgi:hypothetical protein
MIAKFRVLCISAISLEFPRQQEVERNGYDDPVICVYNLSKFGASVAMDIMRTHPLVIMGGLLRENPFFVPPVQFLEELRERRSAQKTVA